LTIVVAGRYVTEGFLHHEEILFKSEDLNFTQAMELHAELSKTHEFARVTEVDSKEAQLEKAMTLLLDIYKDISRMREVTPVTFNRLVEILQ
jgi:hypothetical protein